MQFVLAIDPGSQKTGIALVDERLIDLGHAIVRTNELEEALDSFWRSKKGECNGEFIAILCGDGTNHKKIGNFAESWAHKQGILFQYIDETNSTVEGRAKYWQENPPKGWKRFLPRTWLTPPVPVDDYTAVVLGERFFKERSM